MTAMSTPLSALIWQGEEQLDSGQSSVDVILSRAAPAWE